MQVAVLQHTLGTPTPVKRVALSQSETLTTDAAQPEATAPHTTPPLPGSQLDATQQQSKKDPSNAHAPRASSQPQQQQQQQDSNAKSTSATSSSHPGSLLQQQQQQQKSSEAGSKLAGGRKQPQAGADVATWRQLLQELREVVGLAWQVSNAPRGTRH